jgi:CRP-like cAMP-binding protein
MNILPQNEINNKNLRESLLNSPLFDGLSNNLQDEILSMGTLRRYQRHECLFVEDDPVEYIYYLISGTIKEYYSDGFGDDFLRRVFRPGCYVSLHSVVKQVQSYNYTCMAVQATHCFVLPGNPFHAILKREIELCLKVAVLLSGDYESSCRKNCLCKKTHAVSRVAGYLLSKQNLMCSSSEYHCNQKCQKGQVDLRPLELSACDVCLARESFSRALLMLQERGIVRSRRGVIDILDEDALKVICGIK